MCGILGVVRRSATGPVDGAAVERAAETLAERGPDGSGLLVREGVAFAHRRLAIRDRDGGRQPLLSDDGRCVLTYNGEIYNDGPLRQSLAELGHVFRTRCDTETLLAAYRHWGTDCLARINGMFAFGVYDFDTRTLLLARDRCGVKPLYWCRLAGGVAFASTPAALLRLPEVSARPHWPAVSHYLGTFRTTLGRHTLLDGIETLLPGEFLRFTTTDDGRIEIGRYWDYPQTADEGITAAEARATIEHRLREAVRAQLVSDVPVGLFLSGGVDSSTIGCLTRDVGSGPLTAICGQGASGDEESDDLRFARRSARHIGTEVQPETVTPAMYWRTWRQMVERLALPLSTPNDVLIHHMAKAAKRSVGVVLGGEGADELFGGYAVAQWSAKDFLRTRMRTRTQTRIGGGRLFAESLRRCYGRTDFATAADHFLALNSLIPTAAKPHLLRLAAWSAAGEDEPMRRCYNAVLDERPDERAVARYGRLLHRVNLEGLLTRLDHATMLAGLEARVPFTDHELVEAAYRLPDGCKLAVRGDEPAPFLAAPELAARGSLRSKIVLRQVAGAMMPRALAERPKASFPTQIARWFADEWADAIRSQLVGSSFLREAFRPEAIAELAASPAQAGMWLWPLVNLSLWGDALFG
jgi:asparagine synthase (glutamine-hydrolysing)